MYQLPTRRHTITFTAQLNRPDKKKHLLNINKTFLETLLTKTTSVGLKNKSKNFDLLHFCSVYDTSIYDKNKQQSVSICDALS